MKLLIKRLTEDAKIPKYGSQYAAGMDVCSNVDVEVAPNNRRLIGTGICVQWRGLDAENYYLRVAPRSGLSVKSSIDIGAGVIDYDYTGEIFVCFINNSSDTYKIQKGDKIAQLILTRIERVDAFSEDEEDWNIIQTERGVGGFGSTGR